MHQMDRIAIWMPLLASSGVIACTILIHGAALVANVYFVRRERTLGRLGVGFWGDLGIVAVAVTLMLAAHGVEMALWAGLLVWLGEFQTFDIAFYHSVMNYTTLGYGDIIMSPAWKMLGPIEATNGLLMFGVSTAVIFTVVQRLVWTRFPDLRA
jgi:Ion channel